MSYIDDIQKFSEKNQFDYNHKQIFKQVKKAMKKTGDARTEALINVLKTNYLADVKRYALIKLEKSEEARRASRRHGPELKKKLAGMAEAPAFLEEYVSIINLMAMDVDSTYDPKFMLGMKMDMTKELVDAHLNAITPYEKVKRSLKAEGWEEATRNAEKAKNSSFTRTPIIYNDLTAEPDREVVHQAYIRKEIVKKELSEMGFFKKYFTGEGRAMRNYLKTVEETLKAVSFPERDGAAVMREFTKGLTPESEFQRIHSYIDLKYSSLAKGENAIQAEDVKKELEKQTAKVANKEDTKKKNNVSTKKKADSIDYDAQFAEREREQAEQLKLDAAAGLKKIEGLKKPQSAAESNVQRKNNKKEIANVFAFSLVSVGAKQKDALSVSNTIIGILQGKLTDTWSKTNEYETMLFSKDIFKDVYIQVNSGFSNLKVEDKLVVSQKIANLLLNNFSSIAKNPDYKKYAESYAIQTLTDKEIQELTDYEQNVEDLMKGVKAELGIAVKEDVKSQREPVKMDGEDYQEIKPEENKPEEKPIEVSAQQISAESVKSDNELISNFINNIFESAEADIAEEQRKLGEEAKRKAEEEEARRKTEEEAKRKAEEEEARRKTEEEAKRKAEEEEARRKAEEEEAKRKAAEEEARKKAEEEQKQNEAIVSHFVDDMFGNAAADVEREQKGIEEERKLKEEAERKAEEEETRRKAEEARKQREQEEARVKLEDMQKNRSAHSEQVVANEKNLEKEAKDQERELARKSKEYSQQLDQEKNPEKQKDKKKKQSKVQESVGKVPTSEVSYKLFHTPRIERNIRSQIEAVIDSKLRDNSMAMVWKDSISHVAFYSGGSKIQSFWSDFEKDQTPEAKNATMKKHMTLVFQSAYFSLEMISDYMSKADRFVMAQKISDIMLNELSPVASSSKYADYSKNYFIRYPDHKFIGERDGSVEEILQALTEAGKTLGSEQPKLNTALIEEVAAHKKATSTMTRLGRSNEEICSDYIDDKKLSEQVKVQLSGILKNAKVDEDIVAYMKERMESCLMEVCEEIDKIKYDETKKKEMAGHARGMFSAAYGTLKEKWAFKDTAERIVAAQQIADLYLKNYSPAAFRKELAGDFMNNCVLGNKEFLMEDLGYYEEGNYDTPEEYEAFITEVYEANNSGKFKIDVSKDVNEKTTGEVSPRVESIKPATKEKTFN